jgi:hypothetical protein
MSLNPRNQVSNPRLVKLFRKTEARTEAAQENMGEAVKSPTTFLREKSTRQFFLHEIFSIVYYNISKNWRVHFSLAVKKRPRGRGAGRKR